MNPRLPHVAASRHGLNYRGKSIVPTISTASRSIACCCEVATDWPASGIKFAEPSTATSSSGMAIIRVVPIGSRRRLTQEISVKMSLSETRGSSK